MAPTWSRMVSNLLKRTVIQSIRREASSRGSNTDFISISPEVREALHCGKPVVALETTILTHGMPYPHNRESVYGEIYRNIRCYTGFDIGRHK